MTTIKTVAAMVVVSIVAYLYNVSSILTSRSDDRGPVSGVYSSLCIATLRGSSGRRKRPRKSKR
jgi:hypothetical protein